MEIFRRLNAEEEQTFRQWARDHFVSGKEPDPMWHPVVRDEWTKLQESNDNK